MDRERIKGGLRKASGTVKQKAGKITGNRDLETQAELDKAEGGIRSGVDKAKDAARELFKK